MLDVEPVTVDALPAPANEREAASTKICSGLGRCAAQFEHAIRRRPARHPLVRRMNRIIDIGLKSPGMSVAAMSAPPEWSARAIGFCSYARLGWPGRPRNSPRKTGKARDAGGSRADFWRIHESHKKEGVAQPRFRALPGGCADFAVQRPLPARCGRLSIDCYSLKKCASRCARRGAGFSSQGMPTNKPVFRCIPHGGIEIGGLTAAIWRITSTHS